MKKNNRYNCFYTNLIVIIFFTVFVACRNTQEFIKNSQITNAYVYKIENTPKIGQIDIYFYYIVNEKQYYGSGRKYLIRCVDKVLNHSFPLLYDTKSPENHDILISKYTFEHYQMAFPDSLQWLEHCQF